MFYFSVILTESKIHNDLDPINSYLMERTRKSNLTPRFTDFEDPATFLTSRFNQPMRDLIPSSTERIYETEESRPDENIGFVIPDLSSDFDKLLQSHHRLGAINAESDIKKRYSPFGYRQIKRRFSDLYRMLMKYRSGPSGIYKSPSRPGMLDPIASRLIKRNIHHGTNLKLLKDLFD